MTEFCFASTWKFTRKMKIVLHKAFAIKFIEKYEFINMFHGKKGEKNTTVRMDLYDDIFNMLAYESNYNRCKQTFSKLL